MKQSLFQKYSYLVALGSNLGDRRAFLQKAVERIQSNAKLIAQSSIYETKPIGAADQAFFNAAIVVQSDLEPEEFLQFLMSVEKSLGREREIRWSNRTIDCDILLAQDFSRKGISINTEALTIPHPEMLRRDFVLVPAAEIAGEWQTPQGKSLKASLEEFGYQLNNKAADSILP